MIGDHIQSIGFDTIKIIIADQCSVQEAKSQVVPDDPVLGLAAADQLAFIPYSTQ
jgi:hypothetical protein